MSGDCSESALVALSEVALLEVGLEQLGLAQESGFDNAGILQFALGTYCIVARVKLVGKVYALFLSFSFSSVTVATVVLNESTFVPRSAICIFAAARSLRSVEIVVS